MQLFGEGVNIVKDTVNPVSDREVPFKWLYMDIAGPVLNSFIQDRIYKIDYGRLVRRIKQVLRFIKIT